MYLVGRKFQRRFRYHLRLHEDKELVNGLEFLILASSMPVTSGLMMLQKVPKECVNGGSLWDFHQRSRFQSHLSHN